MTIDLKSQNPVHSEKDAGEPLNLFNSPVKDNVAVTPTYDKAYYGRLFDDIVDQYRMDSPNADFTALRDAFEFSFASHTGQLRQSGLPYFDHIIEVVRILAEQRMDQTTLIAALLHDVIEDTGRTYEEVRSKFGEDVALLVDGLTKISGIEFGSLEIKQAENYRKMLLSMAKDIRVIIIKFADRMHNMRTIESLPPKKQERIAIETRDVYAPLAHRFGMARIRWELEDLALKTLDSANYWELSKLVLDKREERESYIEDVAKPLREKLIENDVQAQIAGRPKHFFSIYNKMKRRNKPFSEIYDLLAIRILVDQKVDCYKALGVVHSTYTPVTERFKDYIAVPKINGYQSIHTTVIGPDGRMVEIQIRTREMHQIAEEGIAAHWLYKEGRLHMDQLDRQIGWIRQLIDRQKDADPGEFLEDLKIDLFQDEVFVFTPKGDLFSLPKGSTAIDFAFAVHSEVGLHCIGAKVAGRLIPLHTELHSGDMVEILTSDQQTPSTHWLDMVKTTKAKSHIKRFFRNIEMEQSVTLGRNLVEQSLRELAPRQTLPDLKPELEKIAREMSFEGDTMLLSSIGRGLTSAQSVAQKFLARTAIKEKTETGFFKRLIPKTKTDTRGISISGVDNLLIHFAKCCNPIPGDSIVGYVTRGRGIHIHRNDCSNIKEALTKDPDRGVAALWEIDSSKTFTVQIRIVGYDRKNFLNDITQKISSADTNIVSADVRTRGHETVNVFLIQVRNISHLNLILDKIRKINGVISADRVDATGAKALTD
ncbi:MAG: bifunctional (p)ppGpp synthetase/guanosine-3',5'-bis(diphosphate) 3'-pyrophosphohydrolase [Bacteroidetes bacterium]|nr:bifunctional (p)ppGpp synthetase/guanosine-3',5'-bis(diphosphate) 3'-pyrophosphohydrolase [Bacteroidota bacterium]